MVRKDKCTNPGPRGSVAGGSQPIPLDGRALRSWRLCLRDGLSGCLPRGRTRTGTDVTDVTAPASQLLPYPDAQLYLPRVSGAGSLRQELESVLDAAPAETTLEGYRELILQRNGARKRSASMRLWTWKRLKLRYVLDPRVPEFHAFRSLMASTEDPAERGLLAFLMMARTDRLFREVATSEISSHCGNPGTAVDAAAVRSAVERLGLHVDRPWSLSVVEGITAHILSACKDYGLLQGKSVKYTVRIRPGTPTLAFAARLARLEGLSDRRALESRWFRLLGLGLHDALEGMHRAARQGVLGFRFQADVAEIVLPEIAEERA